MHIIARVQKNRYGIFLLVFPRFAADQAAVAGGSATASTAIRPSPSPRLQRTGRPPNGPKA